MMEVVVTTGAISRAKLQSNHHHQQTNIQFFYRPDALPSPNQQCQTLNGSLLHCFIVLLCICVVSCPYVIYFPTVMA